MIKKIFLLPLLVFSMVALAQAQTSEATTNKNCSEKKACCAGGKKAACCSAKSTASCDAKKSAFVKKTATATAVANKTESITVSGVCGMCKMRIEKAATSVEGVASANWDDIKQVLTVGFDDSKTTLLDVEKAVAAVGHDTQNVKATDEAYKNLHGCCKYERS